MATTQRSYDTQQRLKRVRVLIADDDFGVRLLLRQRLEGHGAFLVANEAPDGVQAVDAARRIRPDLAVLDLAMPRMDGLEAAAEIRRLLPDTRIVIQSSFSAERMAQKAIDAGADVYVEKAAESAELLAVLEGLFPTVEARPQIGIPGQDTAAATPQTSSVEGLLLDAIDAGVLRVDAAGRVTSANFAATLALDLPTSQLVGTSLTDLLATARHEDGREVAAEAPDPVTASLATGRPLSGGVLRLDASGGGATWLAINVRPVLDEGGSRSSGAVVVVNDVTEERRLREALRDAHARLPGLLDAVSTPVAVLRSWPEGEPGPTTVVVAHANRAARAVTGWVVGSRVHRETVDALDAQVQRVGGDEVVVAWQEAAAGPSATTSSAGAGVSEPSATTDLLEAAVISSPVGAVLLDGAARLVIANPVADRLLGGTFLLGAGPVTRTLRWADSKEPVRDEDLPVRAACEGTAFDDIELFVADEDGSGRGTYVKLSGRPVIGARGSAAGAVISVVDDTAAKEAERALAATHEELRRSNTELASFASTASHDLSQPLHTIYGFVQMLQMLDIDDPRARDYIDRILAGCERMRTLIRDLLTYSRVSSETRPFETVELAGVVQEVVELFEQEIADQGARVEVDALPAVLADRTQMTQLFQNLIGNALTYVADGVRPVVHVTSLRESREWQVTVADNGIGISPENRQRAFAMFERLVTAEEYPGTGIGLAVCAKIVDRHGGRIWIEGNPGGGTRICLTFPDQPPR